jgi:acetylornithine deacetylase/succinyl-diaminopimelate desuccinylase-like protein
MSDLEKYLTDNFQRFDNTLIDFLKIPSISAQPDHKDDMRVACDFLKSYLEDIGFGPRIYETEGHPILYAEYSKAEGKPVALVYGHYDVQPVDPLDLWNSPPFEPVIKDGIVYARGAADDKGQLMAHVHAFETYIKNGGELPINVKIVFEGEEEIASAHLDEFLEANKDMLKADLAIISDTSQFGKDMPALTYGLRGIAACEVKVTGPNRDLHSGSYGGAVANPINVLCEMVGRLHDGDRHIAIDGFYDDVLPVEDWEKDEFSRLPFDEKAYMEDLEVQALYGESGFSTLERKWARPTLDCNGIYGGYMGDGQKTVLPSWAGCKITMRLVPNMDPDKVCDQLEAFLLKVAPPAVAIEVKKLGGAKAAIVSKDNPIMQAAEKALEHGFGKRPFYIREGGSIPIVNTFKELLGCDTILLGLCQPDCNAHSPNEFFGLDDFHRGIRSAVFLYKELSDMRI